MIDLHVHSNISDGTLTPTEVIDLAVKNGLTAMALTDHDTVGGIQEALLRTRFHQENGAAFTFIPGVELSVGYKKRDIHILGLYIDYNNKEFQKLLFQMVVEREERNQKMIQNFQDAGFHITLEELKQESNHAVITRAHFAKQLVKKQYCSTPKEAFAKYLGEDGPFYVNRKFITPEQALEAIIKAGGIPVLAHPMLYHLPTDELEQLIVRLKNHGLKGIETIYSTYSEEEEQEVRRIAEKFHLIMTGGSDFHGEVKPDISIGTGRGNLCIPESILDELEQIIQ